MDQEHDYFRFDQGQRKPAGPKEDGAGDSCSIGLRYGLVPVCVPGRSRGTSPALVSGREFRLVSGRWHLRRIKPSACLHGAGLQWPQQVLEPSGVKNQMCGRTK
jgi:hypothetical protein